MTENKYTCEHAEMVDGSYVCALSVCENDNLDLCCPDCDYYKGPSRGLGDSVKKVTSALGIPQCDGCKKRQRGLNKLTERLYRDK